MYLSLKTLKLIRRLYGGFENITKVSLVLAVCFAGAALFAASVLLLFSLLNGTEYTTACMLADDLALGGMKTACGMATVSLSFELFFLGAGVKRKKPE